MTLALAPELELPDATVTEPLGIFGQRGYGKTSTSVVIVEELYAAGLPSIILDIKGDWWGLRSSKDGKRDGLPFLIFGGEHADVPLGSAATIARFVAERGIPAIIDLSDLSKTKARQWVMEFAETIYDVKRKHRSPMMIVVDEADVLIPQRLSAELMRLLGAMEDIAKRGRQRGLGILVVSQRVADVNKSVTDLLTTLIVHAITGSRTRKALLEWIDDHARDADELRRLLETLSGQAPGEAWVWSPGFLRLLTQIHVRRIKTFDSHATPEPGETIELPRRMADIDVASLSAELQATVEEAKADDPRELRRQVAELQRALAAEQAKPTPAPVEVRVEVPVLAPEIVDQIEAALAPAAALLGEAQETLVKHRMWAESQLYPTEVRGGSYPRRRVTPGQVPVPDGPTPVSFPSVRDPKPKGARRGGYVPEPTPQTDVASDVRVTGSMQRILDALAWWLTVDVPTVSRIQLAMVAGYHPRTKAFTNSLGAMNSSGLITYPDSGLVRLTGEGAVLAQSPAEPPTSEALQQMIYSQVGNARARILQVLVDIHPEEISRDELAEKLGYHPRTKAYTNGLGAMRTLGFLEYPAAGWVKASRLMFVEER